MSKTTLHPFVATPNRGRCGSCGKKKSDPVHAISESHGFVPEIQHDEAGGYSTGRCKLCKKKLKAPVHSFKEYVKTLAQKPRKKFRPHLAISDCRLDIWLEDVPSYASDIGTQLVIHRRMHLTKTRAAGYKYGEDVVGVTVHTSTKRKNSKVVYLE